MFGESLINAAIIGSTKCGTSTLASMLSKHPDICASTPKEPRFFHITENYIKGKQWYLDNYFNHYDGERIVVDCNPNNMLVGFTSERMRITLGEIGKFMVCVRDPIARAYSDWYHFKSMRPGREIKTFDDAISINMRDFDLNWSDSEFEFEKFRDPMGGSYRPTYLENGFYLELKLKFQNHFRESEFKFLLLDDLASDHQAYFDDVCSFLGTYVSRIENDPLNVKKQLTTSDIQQKHPRTVMLMKGFFESSVYFLSEELNIDLKEKWGW